MKKSFAALFVFFIICNCKIYSQSLLLGKWNYTGTEEFGLLTPPDSLHKADFILLKLDNDIRTFEMRNGNETTSGNWVVNATAKTLTLTNSENQKTKLYNLKSISATELVIEYQTPDLVRTRYHFLKSN